MKRPKLNKVSLNEAMSGIMAAKPSVTVTMSVGQWDGFLQTAYDAGYTLIELDANETPVRAYRKREVSADER